MFSHFPLDKLPTCKVIRFNIEYTILYIDEKLPENFTIQELDLFCKSLFIDKAVMNNRICNIHLW
jgi:ribonuclease-3